MAKFIIGTRGSLLAKAQAEFIRQSLEKLSDHQFELKIIKTEGDQVQNKPLWQLDGKDFFTKELDQALQDGSIDLVVHSCKDLSTERPNHIKLAAITKRDFPEDMLLVKKETALKLTLSQFQKNNFVLGTSSPRRIFQAKRLISYLPHGNQNTFQIETKVLRGNVDTRIKKLIAGEYDGILLAAAGVERLCLSSEGKELLDELTQDLTYMILPLQTFAPAPAQGALAIDCHRDNAELIKVVQKLDDAPTRIEVQKEKEIFARFGGGCHQAIGIAAVYRDNKLIASVYGENNEHEIDEVHISPSNVLLENFLIDEHKIFLGMKPRKDLLNVIGDEYLEKVPRKSKVKNKDCPHYLAASYSLENLIANIEGEELPALFAAGDHSMKVLAKAGLWSHGCASSLGEQNLLRLKTAEFFNLFHDLSEEWNVYTHAETKTDLGRVIPSYERIKSAKYRPQWPVEVAQCQAYYWASYPQFVAFCELVPTIKEKVHFCGPGKTAQQFKDAGVPCHTLINIRELNPYLRRKNNDHQS